VSRSALAALALVSAGCGPADRFEAVSLGETAAPFRVRALAAPAPAMLPRLTPCPTGWREVDLPPLACEPWPEGGRHACPADSAHFVGEQTCARVGEACPADGWPAALPAGRTVFYVQVGAAPGGDGSRARPFGTLAQALSGGGAGNVIALSAGGHETGVALPANTVLLGACVGQTTLTLPPGSTSPAIVYATAPGVEVRSVRVTGPKVGLAVAGAGASLLAEDVVVEAATGIGWLVQMNATGTGRNLVIRGTLAQPTGSLGHGLHVVDGSTVTLTRAVVEGNRTTGVFVYGSGAHVTLTRTAVLDTRVADNDGSGGRGVWINNLASARLEDCTVERNTSSAVEALPGTTLTLSSVVARDTRAGRNQPGHGVWVDGAQLTARRLRTEGNAGLGVSVQGSVPAIVEDLLSRRDDGLGANNTARISLSRAAFVEPIGTAITSRLTGTVVTATDVVVVDPQTTPTMPGASAILAMRGGQVVLSRASIRHCRGLCIAVASAGSALVASDLSVEETLPGGDGEGGFALATVPGSSLSLTRATFRSAFTAGLYLLGPQTPVTLDDVEVRESAPPQSQGGLYGNGVVVNDAQVTGSGLKLIDNHDVGLALDGPASRLDMSDVTVLSTALTCLGNPDCAMRVPVGLSALNGAQARLQRFQVSSNGGIGVEVAGTGQLDLSDGEVSFHQIGANVLAPGFDLERLSLRVQYRHNVRALAAESLPLPKIPPPPPINPG
jgi:hypothetical protein